MARQLWKAEDAEAEVLHPQPHHRTPERDAFAGAVGGYDAYESVDYHERCIICTVDDVDKDQDS